MMRIRLTRLLLTAAPFLGAALLATSRPAPATTSTATWAASAGDLHQETVTEAGWEVFAAAVRTSSNTSGSSTAIGGYVLGSRTRRGLSANTSRALLAVRAELEAVKYGRDGSRSTTIPPPAI